MEAAFGMFLGIPRDRPLMTEAPGNAISTWPRLLGPLAPWLQSISIQTLTVLGLFVYGVLRLSSQLFYSRFGVSPEEVGLGYAEMIAQSAVGLLLVTILSFLFISFYAWTTRGLVDSLKSTAFWWADLPWRWVREFRELQRTHVKMAIAYAAFRPLFFGGFWIAHRFQGISDQIGGVMMGVGIVFWFATNNARESLRQPAPTAPEKAPRPPDTVRKRGWRIRLADLIRTGPRAWPKPGPETGPSVSRGLWGWIRQRIGFRTGTYWVMARAAFLVTVLGMYPTWAILDAGRAQRGVLVLVHWPFGFQLTPWSAQPVDLIWRDTTGVSPLPDSRETCLMYLGQSRGVAVVYDVAARRTLRIPMGEVFVRTIPDTARIESPCRPA